MTYPEITFLSLGSNLGKRKASIQQALINLTDKGIQVESVSSFYETEPVGDSGHPAYVNIVCRARTALTSREILENCQKIERDLGRKNKGDRQPRSIDIDILFHGDRQVSTSRLTIPHPELGNRNFVLIPLKEICPDFINPVTGKHIDDMIRLCRDSSWVHRLSTTF